MIAFSIVKRQRQTVVVFVYPTNKIKRIVVSCEWDLVVMTDKGVRCRVLLSFSFFLFDLPLLTFVLSSFVFSPLLSLHLARYSFLNFPFSLFSSQKPVPISHQSCRHRHISHRTCVKGWVVFFLYLAIKSHSHKKPLFSLHHLTRPQRRKRRLIFTLFSTSLALRNSYSSPPHLIEIGLAFHL